MRRIFHLLTIFVVLTMASHSLKAQSNEVMILYNAAYVHQKAYRPNEAMRCLRLAMRLDSTFIPAYNLMGYIYEDAYVRYDSALMTYRKLLDIDSTYAKAYVNIGHIFFLQKKYDEAMQCNEKAVAIDSTYGDAYFNIGWIYNIRGNLEKSIEYIFRAAQYGSREAKEFLDRNGYNDNLQEDYSEGFNDDPK